MVRYNISNLNNFNDKGPLIVQNINSDEIVINLPLEGYTAKSIACLFKIDIKFPAEIKLIGVCYDKFYKFQIKTTKYELITILHSLIMEVFAPDGVMIIKNAPPK